MVYPALLPLLRTPRLPVVDWTDAPADLNALVRFGERRNLVSARVPSHFKRSLPYVPKEVFAPPLPPPLYRRAQKMETSGFSENLVFICQTALYHTLQKTIILVSKIEYSISFRSCPNIDTAFSRVRHQSLYYPTNVHNVKKVGLLKYIKIMEAAQTCFGLQRNHHQGATDSA